MMDHEVLNGITYHEASNAAAVQIHGQHIIGIIQF